MFNFTPSAFNIRTCASCLPTCGEAVVKDHKVTILLEGEEASLNSLSSAAFYSDGTSSSFTSERFRFMDTFVFFPQSEFFIAGLQAQQCLFSIILMPSLIVGTWINLPCFLPALHNKSWSVSAFFSLHFCHSYNGCPLLWQVRSCTSFSTISMISLICSVKWRIHWQRTALVGLV